MAILDLPEKEFFAPGHRACAGCGPAIAMRLATKAAGKNTIVIGVTGCMEVVSTPYPQTAWALPWVHGAFETGASIASGVDAALKAAKRRKGVNVMAISGDGGMFDIGFGALSGALERKQDFLTLCYDNEAYMNTGIQRSGATPFKAWTTTTPIGKVLHGKQQTKKPLPLIVAAHGSPYVATASIGEELDFVKKVRKALSIRGPTFIHVLTPCVPGWKTDPKDTVTLGDLAINTGVQPLYEIENGKLTFTKKITKRRPVKEYLKMQGRFKHLTDKDTAEIQKFVDKNYEWLLSLEKKGQIFPND
tara:strand:+ start:581 stop:1492 length:912 start_codon:yes stop_codon:yes gene_type:complete